MIGDGLLSVNLLLLLAAAGCVAPIPDAQRARPQLPDAPIELQAQLGPGQHGIVGDGPGLLPAARLRELPEPPIRSNLADETSIMLQLASPLSDVSFVDDGGEAIEEALADFTRREIEFYGAGLLTSVQLFGDPFHAPICTSPELRAELEDSEGETWLAALQLPQFQAFVGDLEALMSEISSECVEGVAAAGGDVADAVAARDCTEDEQHQFFEEGESCALCVAENGGDFDACVAEDLCAEEAPRVTWVMEGEEKAWYQLVQGVAWACRPDWLALVYVLAKVPPDGTLPESYDHEDWNYYCFPIYDPDSESVGYVCDAGDGPHTGHALAEGINGRTLWMEDEAGNIGWSRREYYTPLVEMDTGARLRWGWANSSNIGRLSKPFEVPDSNGDGVVDVHDEGYGYPGGSWGINPHALRPGGTDPTSLDDTYARDWLALLALKSATTMDGISILTYNHNRCGAWEGPDEAGRYRCTRPEPPSGDWLNDALNFGLPLEDGQVYDYPVPILTIGSTGLPDPAIPGGIIPLIAGSDRLAEPGWEDCVWDHSFVVDSIPYPDTPWDYEGPASLRGDTYKFGKDPDLDLRMVLNTNIARHYCPEGE